jgi:2,3-bisphosphoglycerate-independent phosphoglycerate mutase
MKIVVFLSDGMADHPIPELYGKTPMMQAHKPHMDRIAREGAAGMIQTIPDGVPPGSDTANMAVMGYDPIRYYSGRSPIEAVSMGIDLDADDVAFRTNLVTLGAAAVYEERVMEDYSADEIGSDEAAQLIETLNEKMSDAHIRFHPGKSYRHCMVWKGGPLSLETHTAARYPDPADQLLSPPRGKARIEFDP